MNYLEIFDEVVSIMANDSSTCKDMGAKDYSIYRSLISNDMDELEFTKTVKKYIATFGVPAHLNFANNKMTGINFSVIRFEDALYVVNAAKESSFLKKDKIIAIDGCSIPEVAKAEREFLMDEDISRQGFLWRQILLFGKKATVVRNGEKIEVDVISEGSTFEDKYYAKSINDKTLLLRLADFADEMAIGTFYQENEQKLDNCEYLIIDVRSNGGGVDTAFFPLFEYCFPEGRIVDDFFEKGAPVSINFSKRNCEGRLKLLDQFFAGGVPDEAKEVIENMKKELVENCGKGFVEDTNISDISVTGKKNPKKVYIITDENCGSSGESFVETMACSPKVTVVGRPTMGILDYSNCTMEPFGDFVLTYPTSRDGKIDEGKGYLRRGVPVDVLIPWSPMHLDRDVELEYVLKEIEA